METSMQNPSSSRQQQRRHVLCVTTAKPLTAASMAGGSGALTMVCPHTGSISASLTISGDLSSTTQAVNSSSYHQQQQQLGISSLSLFSPRISNKLHPSQAPLALAYGGKAAGARGGSNNDCAAMLVSLVAHHPKVHWKARLPEAQLTAGIIVSPCGHYAMGGGASGTLYVWSTTQGHLLKTIHRAHYRAITCLHATGDQRHVLTGGADGMVHLFAWMDLVESSTSSRSSSTKQKTVVPIRTWSQHSVPITCLGSLSDSRMISASQDGLVHVFETFSEAVVATIQLPQGANSLAVRDQRIWIGGSLGTLYCLDLDLYAMHQTIQLGASIAGGSSHHHSGGLSQQQQQQQQSRKGQDSGGSPSYKTTLKGHQHPVTSLALWGDDQGQEFLVSGDASGTLRVWDLGARVCVRIVRPWSNTATDGPVAAVTKNRNGDPKKKKETASQQQQHPITSIQVLDVSDGNDASAQMAMSSMTNATSKAKGGASAWVARLPQLQKYAPSHGMDPDSASAAQTQWTPAPLWNNAQPQNDTFWDVSTSDYGRKRPRLATVTPNRSSEDLHDTPATANSAAATTSDGGKDDELQQLRKQLEEANSTIARWETVNNQLMEKLPKK